MPENAEESLTTDEEATTIHLDEVNEGGSLPSEAVATELQDTTEIVSAQDEIASPDILWISVAASEETTIAIDPTEGINDESKNNDASSPESFSFFGSSLTSEEPKQVVEIDTDKTINPISPGSFNESAEKSQGSIIAQSLETPNDILDRALTDLDILLAKYNEKIAAKDLEIKERNEVVAEAKTAAKKTLDERKQLEKEAGQARQMRELFSSQSAK